MDIFEIFKYREVINRVSLEKHSTDEMMSTKSLYCVVQLHYSHQENDFHVVEKLFLTLTIKT